MQPIRPVLGDLDLQQVQRIEVDGDQVLTRHGVPALEGDFYQRLGRRGAVVTLTGVLTGPEAREGLADLRARFRNVEPILFAADLASATRLDEVLIEDMQVTERAGHPDCFEYAFRLREFTLPEPIRPEVPEEPPPPNGPIAEDTGTLIVNVEVEDEPAFDFSKVTVTASGETDEGTTLNRRPLTNRTDNRWTEEEFPAGSFSVEAVVPDEQLSGTELASVRPGETTELTIVLRRGVPVAEYFLIHYRFDSAFVEPCMREVLRQVAQHAADNPAKKFLLVGHTDLVGPPAYNQSLSERRARGAFAFLRFGNDPDASVAEWDQLRRRRPAGVTRSLNDSWGAREYQQMLQDLGFYTGQINGRHNAPTDAAVKEFQRQNGLNDDGDVGDATWPVLIRAYLAQDNLSIPDDRFLPNCPGEILRWLGCGELDPVRNTQDAWRPNRRTEFLFVNDDTLPADVAEPDTFDLPPPQGVGAGWCLNDSGTSTRCCFVVSHVVQQSTDPDAQGKEQCEGALVRGPAWRRQLAEPQPEFVVRGSIRFEDGTPLANAEFVFIASDGEFMTGEVPDSTGSVRAGTPLTRRTRANGEFVFDPPDDKLKTPGIFVIEIHADVVARLEGQPLEEAEGPVVCKRLTAPGDSFDVIVVGQAAAGVRPTLTAPDVVVVRKPHTNPARQPVELSVDTAFNGTGTLTVEAGETRVRLFDAAAAGNEIAFDGTDNVFTSDQLVAGVTLFIEGGADPSAAVDDVELRLLLAVGGQPGFADREQLTSVRLALDVALSRPAGGGAVTFLSEADKANIGRFAQVADPNFSHERAILRASRPEPADITGDLVLAPFGNAAAFTAELPAQGQLPLPNQHVIPVATIPATGLQLFAEGRAPSQAARDAGFQLGIRNLDNDGDRVLMTLVQVDIADDDSPATATQRLARIGLWDRAYDAAGELLADVVSNDARRFHFRVRDAGAAPGQLGIRWRSLLADRATGDDAPASQDLTLIESAPGSRFYISRGVMLVNENLDRNTATPSGLPPNPARAEPRAAGQSDHRLRRARIDGFVRGEYAPTVQPGSRLSITFPVFNRNPDERRRLPARVVRYNDPGNANYHSATNAYIAQQFARANTLWNRVGLQIDPDATQDRNIPAAAINPATGLFPFAHPGGAQEMAVLRDLIPTAPDNTLTVVFVHLTGANAYAAILDVGPIPNPPNPNLAMGNRFFIFVNTALPLTDETLAHELHHVVFNRVDSATQRRFFTFNTFAPSVLAAAAVPPIALPDRRIYRRVQNRNSPDPDNDPAADNIVNWYRRLRAVRYPPAAALGAATATTGNTLVGNF